MNSKIMSKNILITGANGALAQKLIEKYNNKSQYNITASTRNIQNLKTRLAGVNYINNTDLIETEILKNIDIVVNCAFPRTEDIKAMHEAMLFYKCLVLKSIDMGTKGFINISSQSVYGSYRETPSYEINDLNPEDIYALTKCLMEDIGWALAKDTPLKLTSIRLASLIGVEYPERVINKMIKFGQQNRKITVQNDKNIFGYLDIEDAAEGIYQFIKNSDIEKWKAIYNFGVKPDYSQNLAFIAKEIKKLFEKRNIKIELEIIKKEKADKLQIMNSKWFYEDSNWQPKITLEKSIEKIFFAER